MKKVIPLFTILGLAAAMYIVDLFAPVKQVFGGLERYLGFLLIALYIATLVWFFVRFQREGTTHHPDGRPSKLITDGLFKYSRNPIYLMGFVGLLGWGLWLGALTALVLPILMPVVVTLFVIPMEEKNLEEAFGAEYIQYKKRVRRWI